MRHYAASVGIPSGRSFARFDAFGIYTRLTARGRHDEMDWCTRTATSALASGVKATSPSIPAVLRPALRCVTCRTEVPRAFRTVHPIRWTIWKGEVLPRPKKSFSPEFKDEAVKMVIETSRPIARVAKELGI